MAREQAWRRNVERCASGDHAALAALYDDSSPLVYSVAMRMLADTADAEEVTMDVYTQVWRTAPSYEAERGSVTAWLVTLARSRAIDRLRARASRVQREQPLVEFTDLQADTASPESATEAGMRRQRVLAALATLSPEQREAVELAFFSGLSHTELAGRLGQPLGTVKTRIRSGMIKLREQLEAYADG
jgi:RNA polymerase sigma-70 factor (ECF subfamily)